MPADRERGQASVRPSTTDDYPLRPPPQTRRRPKVYLGPWTPASSPRASGIELTPAVTPSGSEGWDPLRGRGSRLHHALSGPGRGRRGCCPEATGAGRGAAPRRRAARGGARGPDSPCGALGFGPSCSREWLRRRLQPTEPRMRGGRPAAAQHQPGPAPAPGTPAQPPARPRPARAPPRQVSAWLRVWKCSSWSTPLTGSFVGSWPRDLVFQRS